MNNKKVGLIAVVIFVILVAIGVNRKYPSSPKSPNNSTEITDINEIPVITSVSDQLTSKPENKSPKNIVVVQEHDYEKSLIQFEDKRIQFGQNCNAIPNRSVFNQGEKIMIDNRSSEMKGIKIGDQNILIQAYDFSIINLYQKGEFGVNCGLLKNTATIIVQ